MNENVHVIDHPLIKHKLAHLRNRETPGHIFRDLMREVGLLLGYELLRDLPTKTVTIETPMEKMEAEVLEGKKVCIVPILRAGNGK